MNTAIQAARLDMQVQIIGKIGLDAFGELIVGNLQAEGVETVGMLRAERGGTGTTVILSGVRSGQIDSAMITYNGANELLEPGDPEPLPERPAAGGKGLFFVGDFFALPRLQPGVAELLAGAREKGWVTVMDHGRFRRSHTPERTLRSLEQSLEWVDVYMPSEREIRELTGRNDLGEALKEVQERYGVRWIVVKRGAGGCRVRSFQEDLEVPSFPIREGGGVSRGRREFLQRGIPFRVAA